MSKNDKNYIEKIKFDTCLHSVNLLLITCKSGWKVVSYTLRMPNSGSLLLSCGQNIDFVWKPVSLDVAEKQRDMNRQEDKIIKGGVLR